MAYDRMYDDIAKQINGKFREKSNILYKVVNKIKEDESQFFVLGAKCNIFVENQLKINYFENEYTIYFDGVSKVKNIYCESCETKLIFPLTSDTESINFDKIKTFFKIIDNIEKELKASKYDEIIDCMRNEPFEVIALSDCISYKDKNDNEIELKMDEVKALLFRALGIDEC